MGKKKEGELVSNRQAYHNYEVLETFEAGIVLVGTEIKSLRDNGGNLQDNYIVIKDHEAWLKMSSIAPFKYGNVHNHEERRDRKLLLHKYEIERLDKAVKTKGLTLIALSFYLKKGLIKLKIGLCKGKKSHDKRASIKEREQKRAIDRAIKGDA